MEVHIQSSETAGSIGKMASLDLTTILRNTSTSVTLSQKCLDRTMSVLFGCLKRNGMRQGTTRSLKLVPTTSLIRRVPNSARHYKRRDIRRRETSQHFWRYVDNSTSKRRKASRISNKDGWGRTRAASRSYGKEGSSTKVP